MKTKWVPFQNACKKKVNLMLWNSCEHLTVAESHGEAVFSSLRHRPTAL